MMMIDTHHTLNIISTYLQCDQIADPRLSLPKLIRLMQKMPARRKFRIGIVLYSRWDID